MEHMCFSARCKQFFFLKIEILVLGAFVRTYISFRLRFVCVSLIQYACNLCEKATRTTSEDEEATVDTVGRFTSKLTDDELQAKKDSLAAAAKNRREDVSERHAKGAGRPPYARSVSVSDALNISGLLKISDYQRHTLMEFLDEVSRGQSRKFPSESELGKLTL